MNDHSPRGNSFRAAVLRGERPALLVEEKQPRLQSAGETLAGEIVPRAEPRRTDHRWNDRHRLSGECVSLRHAGGAHEVELINLSGGGAMIRADFQPRLWDLVQLELSDEDTIECAVRWIRDGMIGLEFAHETRLDCDPDYRARLLLEVIQRSFPEAISYTSSEEHPAAMIGEQDAGHRAETRHPLIWKGELHYGFDSHAVRLRNVSSGGALIDVGGSCPAGLEVVLDLGNAGSYPATVSWSRGDQAGLKFAEPFDLACLSKARPDLAPQHWVRPSFLDQVPDDSSPWDTQWSRRPLNELHSELEGFLKR